MPNVAGEPAETPPATPDGAPKAGNWFTQSWNWLAALVVATVGVAILTWSSGLQICTEELGGKDKNEAVEVCRAIQLTDPVVIAWALVVLLLLWGTLSEGSIAGLFSFKRQVTQAVSESKAAKETAEHALSLVSFSQHQATQVIVSQGVPGRAWREAPADDNSLRRTDDPQSQTLRALAELAISTILADLIREAGLPEDTGRAHTYLNADGRLTRVDGPNAGQSRAWPIGTGAVGMAWDQRAFLVQRLDDPDFVAHPDYFISTVAAAPILNATGRPIGVISLYSRAEQPPDLDSDLVFQAMLDATELMARVYVNLAAWETDADNPAGAWSG
jgi:hypothetical protein